MNWCNSNIRFSELHVIQSPSWSKFHGESSDNLNYLPNSCLSFLYSTFTMAYFTRSFIYLWMSAGVQPPHWPWLDMRCANINKLPKNGFSACKNSFYVKIFRLLQKCVVCNPSEDCQKLPNEILIKMAHNRSAYAYSQSGFKPIKFLMKPSRRLKRISV